MFFSATLDGEVGELARAYTHSPVRIEARASRPSGARRDRPPASCSVTPDNKVETLVELLHDDERGLALVFVRTKPVPTGSSRSCAATTSTRSRCTATRRRQHASSALAHFEAGKVTTLIATDVAARGLDVDDITHVINFDPPEDATAYTHRVGRTGRAGRCGTGVTLVLPEQQADVSRVARLQGQVESYEAAGLTLAKPKLVYTSRRRGGRSKW